MIPINTSLDRIDFLQFISDVFTGNEGNYQNAALVLLITVYAIFHSILALNTTR